MLPEITKEWIQKAEEDYGFASSGIEHTEYFGQIFFISSRPPKSILKHS